MAGTRMVQIGSISFRGRTGTSGAPRPLQRLRETDCFGVRDTRAERNCLSVLWLHGSPPLRDGVITPLVRAGILPLLFRTLATLVLATACVAVAQAPADLPAPRTDQNSLTAHAQLIEKARRGGIDIYFEGDSIARRWGAT